MRLIDRILWKMPCFLAALALTVACNKIETFDGAFVAFDTAKSSVVSIDAEGEFTGSYTLRYTGPKPSAPIVVSFAVTCGDGLSEGIDYKVATVGGKITFMPGIYEQTIKIDWLPHDIDERPINIEKNCLPRQKQPPSAVRHPIYKDTVTSPSAVRGSAR